MKSIKKKCYRFLFETHHFFRSSFICLHNPSLNHDADKQNTWTNQLPLFQGPTNTGMHIDLQRKTQKMVQEEVMFHPNPNRGSKLKEKNKDS